MSVRVSAPPGRKLFNIADIPVAASPWFLLLVAFWVAGSSPPIYGLIFALAATFSIVVHELGHALMARRFGLRPSVLLWGFGGLCSHRPPRSRRQDVLVVAAGPAAGIVLGVAIWLLDSALGLRTGSSPTLAYLIDSLIYVNIWWSVVNLLPLWPLDGGQLFRHALTRFRPGSMVDRDVHATSLVVCAGGVVYAAVEGSFFLAIMAVLLGWMNVKALAPYSSRARELMARIDGFIRRIFGGGGPPGGGGPQRRDPDLRVVRGRRKGKRDLN